MSRQKSSPRFRFVFSAALLLFLSLLVPALQAGDRRLYLLAAIVTGGMVFIAIVPARLFALDRLILSLVLYLGAVGIVSLAPADPDAALMQLVRFGIGAVALIIGAVMIRFLSASGLASAITSFLGLLLLSGGLFAGNRVPVFTEPALLLLILSFASLVSRHGGFVPLLPGLAGIILLLLQGMAVEAAVLAAAVLLLLWSSDGRAFVSLAALAVFIALFFAAGRLDRLPALVSSEEHAASLNALVNAGLLGIEGSAAVDPLLPASSLLYPLAGHFGLIMTGLTLLLYLPLMLRCASVAGSARSRFHAVLAMGCTLIVFLRVPAGLLSAFGILPLSVFPLPLLTTSPVELCSQMLALGLLCGISSVNEADLAEDAHLAMLAK